MIQKGNATLLRCFPKDYFAADVDRRKCLHTTSSNALFWTQYIGNMIYHKFSHGDVSYRFNGKNVNVMLKSPLKYVKKYRYCNDLNCLGIQVWANSVDSDQTAPDGTDCSVCIF